MLVKYIYCPKCGYEGFDEVVAFSRTTAPNDDWYVCPSCKEETSNVEIET